MKLRPKLPGIHARIRLQIALCFAVAAVFTLFIIQISLKKGKLALPTTYDDVTYCIDGADRMWTLYEGGPFALFRSLAVSPPHSPYSTIMAMSSFIVFGVHEWAPYVTNGLIVFIYLLVISSLLRKCGTFWRLVGCTVALTTPITTNAINEFKPDIFCGLLTAIAMWAIWRNIVFIGDRWQRFAGIAAMSAALFTKPTFTPATLLFCGSAALSGVVCRHLLRGGSWRRGFRKAVVQLGIVGMIATPFFLLTGKELIAYIQVNAFGANQEIWAVKGGMLEQALYFITGPGGGFMIGRQLLFLVIIASAGLAAMDRGRKSVALCHAFFPTSCAITYLLPTIMVVKNPFSGVQMVFLLIFWAMFSLGQLARVLQRLTGFRKRIAMVLGAIMAILSVGWIRLPIGGAGEMAIIRKDLIDWDLRFLRDRALKRARLGISDPLIVAVTTAGMSNNASVLQFLLAKERFRGIAFRDLHMQGDLNVFAKTFAESDIVLANEPNSEEAFDWLPSGKIQGQTLKMVQSDPAFFLADMKTTVANRKYYQFERASGFSPDLTLTGFGNLEGPYPQWNLPQVRWGLAPKSAIQISTIKGGFAMLVLCGLSYQPDQTLSVIVQGKEVLRHHFEKQGVFETLTVPITLDRDTSVELVYAAGAKPTATDQLQRAVLFRCIKVLN